MSYQEKYSVSKRGQTSGPFTATEIIDLLRMKEISTIHKVKLGNEWLSVSDFIEQYEKGLLPEQNLDKVFEDEAEQETETEVEKDLAPEPEVEKELEPEPQPIEIPEPGAATEIHINRSGTQFGPYLFKELKDYLKAGNLRFSDMVWYEGVPEWVPLSKIPGVADGLSSLGSAAPPPPKPPPAPSAPSVPPLVQSPSKPLVQQANVSSKPDENFDKSEDSGEVPDKKSEPTGSDFEISELASHGNRILAGLIDGAILLSVVGLLLGIAGAVSQFDYTLIIAGLIAYLLLGWLYYGLGESSKSGGFIGKKISKIQVVRLIDDTTPSFGVSSLRSILKILFSLTLILPFMVLLTPKRQGLHDLACGTIVKAKNNDN